MPRPGFVAPPEFEEVTVDLDFYKAYGPVVQYRTKIRTGNRAFEPSAYVPIGWFPEAAGFPARIRMTLSVPPGTKWRNARL